MEGKIKKRTKRLFSMLLSLVMVLSATVAPGFSVETKASGESEATESSVIAITIDGETIYYDTVYGGLSTIGSNDTEATAKLLCMLN